MPRSWGIQQIPNLLDSYYNKVADEHAKKLADDRGFEMLKDYVTEFNGLP